MPSTQEPWRQELPGQSSMLKSQREPDQPSSQEQE